MHRIDTANASITLPNPLAVGSNPDGFFEQRSATKDGTLIDCDFWNSLQEEICRTIIRCGIALDKTDNTQLYDAINALIASGGTGSVVLADDLDVLGFETTSSADITISANDTVTFDCAYFAIVGNLNLNSTTAIDSFLNEDDLVSNSATAIPSADSIRNYINTSYATSGDIYYMRGYTNTAIAQNTIRYVSIGAPRTTTGSADIDKAYSLRVPFTGSLVNAFIAYPAVPGGVGSYTFTLMKNGVASALTTTDTGFGGGASLFGTLAVTAGDLIQLKVDVSATATTIPSLEWVIRGQ